METELEAINRIKNNIAEARQKKAEIESDIRFWSALLAEKLGMVKREN